MRATDQALEQLAEGVELFELGDFDQAANCFQEALAADPFCAPAANNLGLVHLEAGDLQAAAALFERARKLAPQVPEPLINLSIALERSGRYDDAASELERAQTLGGFDPEIETSLRRLEALGAASAERAAAPYPERIVIPVQFPGQGP